MVVLRPSFASITRFRPSLVWKLCCACTLEPRRGRSCAASSHPFPKHSALRPAWRACPRTWKAINRPPRETSKGATPPLRRTRQSRYRPDRRRHALSPHPVQRWASTPKRKDMHLVDPTIASPWGSPLPRRRRFGLCWLQRTTTTQVCSAPFIQAWRPAQRHEVVRTAKVNGCRQYASRAHVLRRKKSCQVCAVARCSCVGSDMYLMIGAICGTGPFVKGERAYCTYPVLSNYVSRPGPTCTPIPLCLTT